MKTVKLNDKEYQAMFTHWRFNTAFILYAWLFMSLAGKAEEVLEISEDFSTKKTVGKVNGGTWTSEGWKTLTVNDYIQYDIPTCSYGRIEFQVKGIWASNSVFPNVDWDGSENVHYSLFTMWDRDDNNVWYGQYPNGIRQWHNPWKVILHIFGYVVGDRWKWQCGRFRANIAALWGGYEDDPHAFEIDYGKVPWEKDKIFHVKLEWGQGHMYYYIDNQLYAHADYSSFGCQYAPPNHSMRLGSGLGCKGIWKMQAPVGITYLNFKFYRNTDITPPSVVGITPSSGSANVPLDSYISVTFNEPIDKNTIATGIKIIPPVSGQMKITGNTVFFELTELLKPETTYTIYVNKEIKDLSGNSLSSSIEAFFTTGPLDNQNVEKYGIFEVPIIVKGLSGNKYTAYRLRGVFKGPTKTVEIDGFWNGGDIWKVRMAPTEVGQWTYTISGSIPQFSKTGSFTVVDSNRKGFIRQNPQYPYTFMWDDGTPWLWKGETCWRAFTQLFPLEGRYKYYIDLRASQGYNAVQSIVVSYINGDAFWANEGGTAFELTSTGKNYDKINPAYFEWIDRRIEYANAKGIVPVIFFTWAQELVKFSDDQFRGYIKYLVARWAAYNVIWCVSGEYTEAIEEGKRTRSQFIDYGNIIYNSDPYKHIITLHPGGGKTSSEFVWEKWFGCSMQQWSLNFHQNILNDRAKAAKPVVNGEYAYADYHDNEDCRRGAWEIFTAGGFFTAGFYHTYAPDKGGWDPEANMQQQLELMWAMAFMEKTQWWKMSPNDALVNNGYCLADPGNEYVVYSRNGGPVTINLSAVKGTLDMQWMNPKTNEHSSITKVNGGGSVTLTPP
ncbi:MAG: DUF4038 domain-containing protein, partial [candidate division KSB1 bacterium]|nr:DUF4038 domain-containing protein [candidate division KSB1 bacterium]